MKSILGVRDESAEAETMRWEREPSLASMSAQLPFATPALRYQYAWDPAEPEHDQLLPMSALSMQRRYAADNMVTLSCYVSAEQAQSTWC